MVLKKLLWLVPFVFFATGYFVAHLLFRAETLQTPAIVGLPLATAVKKLSEQGIGVRISAHKPSSDLPEGTVLIQSPAAGQTIKTHQTVFLVIAEQPPLPTAPSFLSHTREKISKEAAQQGIAVTFAFVPYQAPADTCFAQYPAPGQPLTKPTMLIYCAEKAPKQALWPSFIGSSVSEVISWCEAMHIDYEITSASTHYTKKKLLEAPIIDQSPRAGSIIQADPATMPTALLHIP